MNEFDWQIIQLIQGKSEEEVEKIVLQLCDTYGLNFYQAQKYVEDLKNKMRY